MGDTAFPLLPILVPITPLASFLPIPTVANGCDLEKVGDVDRDGGVGPAAVTEVEGGEFSLALYSVLLMFSGPIGA